LSDFTFSTKNGIEYLEAEPLTECGFLVHAFCTRLGGTSEGSFASLNFSSRVGDAKENVQKNGAILAEAFNFSTGQLLMMNQMHGDGIWVLNGSDAETLPLSLIPPSGKRQFDALITDQPGIAIGIKTADCVPVLLADRVRRVIGAVHAGRRGTALNIAGKAVDAFAERFSSRKTDILAAIGPSIGRCCYQVDAAVCDDLVSCAGASSFLHPCVEEGRWMLDLPSLNRFQIEERGVPPENISSSGFCTSCRSDLFFSHRRDMGKTGRHLNFIMLKEMRYTNRQPQKKENAGLQTVNTIFPLRQTSTLHRTFRGQVFLDIQGWTSYNGNNAKVSSYQNCRLV
jgi:polyphenol oxidase